MPRRSPALDSGTRRMSASCATQRNRTPRAAASEPRPARYAPRAGDRAAESAASAAAHQSTRRGLVVEPRETAPCRARTRARAPLVVGELGDQRRRRPRGRPCRLTEQLPRRRARPMSLARSRSGTSCSASTASSSQPRSSKSSIDRRSTRRRRAPSLRSFARASAIDSAASAEAAREQCDARDHGAHVDRPRRLLRRRSSSALGRPCEPASLVRGRRLPSRRR